MHGSVRAAQGRTTEGERDLRSGLVLSYLALRRAIGVIGMSLPVVLAVGKTVLDGGGLAPSLSDYYFTGMRDVFVGSLCAIAVFLCSYRYDRPDAVAGGVAGVAALGVALFPTAPGGMPTGQDVTGVVHLVCAATFFLTLAWFCLGLFPRTHPDVPPTAAKRRRNVVYRVCGGLVVLGVAGAALSAVLPAELVDRLHPVFWSEAVAVTAFGVAWFVKGETLLQDSEADRAADRARPRSAAVGT
jgi:hypothetical protein